MRLPHFNDFNGWQRLWLVLCVLWFIAATAWTASTFPTEAEYRDSQRSLSKNWLQTFDSRMKEIEVHCRKLARVGDDDLDFLKYRECREANKTDYEQVQAQKREKSFELIQEEERYVQDELSKRQAIFIATGAALWLISCVVLYAIGLAVAWVRRGFRGREV